MVIENLVFYSASNLVNQSGRPAIQPQDTDGILSGSTFSFGSGAPIPVRINDTDTGNNSRPGDNTQTDFDDGTDVNQVLADSVTLTFFNGSSTVTRTFPAGTQVQAESIVTFAQYSIIVIRFENPDSPPGPPLINAGYTVFDSSGNPVQPPPNFNLGAVTGSNADGTTPYTAILCFAAGTLIETATGARPVETLAIGDLVLTADHGMQPLSWTGQMSVLPNRKDLWPVVIPAGVLGNTAPLAVSPQHRLRLQHAWAELMFGVSDVLVPAHALVGTGGVARRMPLGGVTYVHLACDGHELVRSNGAWSETLLTGEAMLTPDAAVAADAFDDDGRAGSDRQAARPVLKAYEARLLAQAVFGAARDAAPLARSA